jgi:hypothetical protein
MEEYTQQAPDDLGACTLLGFLLHYAGAPAQARSVFQGIQAQLPQHTHARAFLEVTE